MKMTAEIPAGDSESEVVQDTAGGKEQLANSSSTLTDPSQSVPEVAARANKTATSEKGDASEEKTTVRQGRVMMGVVLLIFVAIIVIVATVLAVIHPGKNEIYSNSNSNKPYHCSWSNLLNPTIRDEDHPNVGVNDVESWSTMVFVSHNDQFNLWKEGEPISPGLRLVMQCNDNSLLLEELKEAGANINSFHFEGAMSNSIGGDPEIAGDDRDNPAFFPSSEHPLVSTFVDLSPSPDWFTGVDSMVSYEPDGSSMGWSIGSLPFDAGYSNKTTFDVMALWPCTNDVDVDVDVDKRGIVQLADKAAFPEYSIFYNDVDNQTYPISEWECHTHEHSAATTSIWHNSPVAVAGAVVMSAMIVCILK